MPSQMDMIKFGMELRACNKMVIVAAVIVVISAILSVCALATPRWKVGEVNNGLGHYMEGLFSKTVCDKFGRKCETQPLESGTRKDWQRAVQAFVIVATLLMLLLAFMSPFIFCGVWDNFPLKERKSSLFTAAVCLLSGVFMLLAVVVYAIKTEGHDLETSFGLAIIVAVLDLAAGVIFALCFARDIDIHT